MAAAQRIGHILDVVDRKVVIPPLLEVGRNTLALAVEYRDVEDAALAEQRIGGIGKDDLFEELVPELIGNGVDPVRLAPPGGDPPPAGASGGSPSDGRERPQSRPGGIQLERGGTDAAGALSRLERIL